MASTELVGTQWGAYQRSRLLSWGGSIVVLVLVTGLCCVILMERHAVANGLRQLLEVVNQVTLGNLEARAPVGGSDETSDLAEALNRMTRELQRRGEELSMLNALAATVSQSLNLEEVLGSALDEVLDLIGLKVGWITLREKHSDGTLVSEALVPVGRPVPAGRSVPALAESFRLAASRGLSEQATRAHAQCNWDRCICAEVFDSGRSRVFRLEQQHACPAAEYLQKRNLVCRACVPLKSREHVLGVMSLAGVPSHSIGHLDGTMFTKASQDMLTAIGRQIGIAVENASLYEELRSTEMLRRQLMERGIDLQEEERKRIARELHDQTSQRLTSVLMTLGVLGEASSLAEAQMHVRDLRDAVAQTLDEVHDLALELRPRLLDDLGLLAALRHYLREYRDKFRMPVDLQVVGLGDTRLPSRVETALYRVVQESLVNVAKHARADSVGVLLEVRDTIVILVIEDDGLGFDVDGVMGSHVHEGNLGLYGMRERAFLLGGTLTIESTPGMGTSVFVEIPLEGEVSACGQDQAAGS